MQPFHLIGMAGCTGLFLRRAEAHLTREEESVDCGSGAVSQRLEARLTRAELEGGSIPGDDVLVDVRFDLVHIPFFRVPSQLNLSRRHVRLRPARSGAVTHSLYAGGIPYRELEQFDETVSDLCWLMSLASGNLVSVARVHVFNGDDLVKVSLHSPAVAKNRIALPTLAYYASGRRERLNGSDSSGGDGGAGERRIDYSAGSRGTRDAPFLLAPFDGGDRDAFPRGRRISNYQQVPTTESSAKGGGS